ncbi:hypothetical protein ADL29_12640 [Streptomyces chattanoogensis]|uniref:Uncharacterized protein n=1 Tax=Streptomyces chattanoogensis TaxID=66876 RepID=A0A0N0H1B5_9ACTN|nr:hypothetical protein ADL29_12640 [Streptomyces chattanoogensis]
MERLGPIVPRICSSWGEAVPYEPEPGGEDLDVDEGVVPGAAQLQAEPFLVQMSPEPCPARMTTL